MAGYIEIPIETDPAVLSATAIDTLVEALPGFVPREGHLEVWLVEVWARMVAEARDVASDVPTTIFRYFGQSMLGIPPVVGQRASTTVSFTSNDTLGYTVPAETIVAFRTAGDELVPFQTLEDVVISPGSSVVAGVEIEALEEGSLGNGLGPGGIELVDALSYIAAVTADQATSGGVDEETDEAYLDRLAAELQLLAPRPILAEDFAVLARRTGEVHRAVALDGYNPTDQTFDNERMVAVALVDIDGQPVSQAAKDETQTRLDNRREVNFVAHIIDPTYTVIDVTFAVTAWDDFDLADVEARAVEAVSSYLSPATWGGGNESPPEWRSGTKIVRYLEVAQVVNNVPGVDYVKTLEVNAGTVDVTMSGVAPLPNVGIVTATVTYD